MPPMKIKMGKELNAHLGRKAIIDGYVQIPVYTYTDANMADDVSTNGCPYLNTCDGYYWTNPETFTEEYDIIYPILRDPIKIAFNLTEEETQAMKYTDMYNYADIFVSE